MTVNLMDR